MGTGIPRATWGTKQTKAGIGGDAEACAHAHTDPISGQEYFNPCTCQGCRGSAGLIPFASCAMWPLAAAEWSFLLVGGKMRG